METIYMCEYVTYRVATAQYWREARHQWREDGLHWRETGLVLFGEAIFCRAGDADLCLCDAVAGFEDAVAPRGGDANLVSLLLLGDAVDARTGDAARTREDAVVKREGFAVDEEVCKRVYVREQERDRKRVCVCVCVLILMMVRGNTRGKDTREKEVLMVLYVYVCMYACMQARCFDM